MAVKVFSAVLQVFRLAGMQALLLAKGACLFTRRGLPEVCPAQAALSSCQVTDVAAAKQVTGTCIRHWLPEQLPCAALRASTLLIQPSLLLTDICRVCSRNSSVLACQCKCMCKTRTQPLICVSLLGSCSVQGWQQHLHILAQQTQKPHLTGCPAEAGVLPCHPLDAVLRQPVPPLWGGTLQQRCHRPAHCSSAACQGRPQA